MDLRRFFAQNTIVERVKCYKVEAAEQLVQN
jgi:hypothetical protein